MIGDFLVEKFTVFGITVQYWMPIAFVVVVVALYFLSRGGRPGNE